MSTRSTSIKCDDSIFKLTVQSNFWPTQPSGELLCLTFFLETAEFNPENGEDAFHHPDGMHNRWASNALVASS